MERGQNGPCFIGRERNDFKQRVSEHGVLGVVQRFLFERHALAHLLLGGLCQLDGLLFNCIQGLGGGFPALVRRAH